MIGTMLILGGAILGAGIIATFWEQIRQWLARVLDKVKTLVKGAVQGVRIFFTKMQIRKMRRHFMCFMNYQRA